MGSKKKAPSGSLLSRRQAAEILGVSVSKIRRMQDAGTLESIVDDKGQHWFERADLEPFLPEGTNTPVDDEMAEEDSSRALATTPDADGELHAKLFKAFSTGKEPVNVVQEYRVAPAIVTQAHDTWLAMKARSVQALDGKERLERLEAGFENLRKQVRKQEQELAALRKENDALRLSLGTLEQRLAQTMAPPPRTPCQCGGVLVPNIQSTCTNCGATGVFFF
jgi:DNA-binding transcriptional MerR regulator